MTRRDISVDAPSLPRGCRGQHRLDTVDLAFFTSSKPDH